MYQPISFPGLGITINPDPTLFTIYGHEFKWYGLIIAMGFLLAAVYAIKRSNQFGLTQDNILDLIICVTPAALIGARLYYVIFNWRFYSEDPIKMIYIWDGGIAIYGAIIAACLTAVIFARFKHIKPLAILDIGALSLLIGQSVGRWGNFINREAYGSLTTLPWGMEIYSSVYGARAVVHPTFLYESLWNALGFLILHFFSKKRRYDGQIFFLYVAWYGLGRGFIESFRTDSLMLFGSGLRVSQLLGFLSCALAMLLIAYMGVFKKHSPEEMQVYRYNEEKRAEREAGAVVFNRIVDMESAAAGEAPKDAPAKDDAPKSGDDETYSGGEW